MKLPFIKSSLIVSSVLAIIASGCLKDEEYDNGKIQSVRSAGTQKIIEIKLTAASVENVLSLALDESLNDTVIDLIPVNLASVDPAPQDLHVTLAANPQIIADYNAAHTDTTVTPSNPDPSGVVTHYQVAELYTIVNPGGIVTIPKGSHTGYLQIKFKPSDFLGDTYAVGFTLNKIDESGYTLSGNMNNGMVVINIKNQYDGVYSRKGYALRAGDADLTGPIGPDEISLTTLSGNTVQWIENHQWGNGGGQLAATIAYPIWTINNDNTVTVTSDGGPFPSGLMNFPGYDSRYVPATRTFYVKATWGGGPGVREMTDTLVYLRPR